MSESEKISFLEEPLELLIGWLAVTVAGFYIGAWGGDFLVSRVEFGSPMAEMPVVGAVQGLCVGLGQWFLLRGRLPGAFLWILVSIAGFSLINFVQVLSIPLASLSAMLEVVLITVQGGLLGLVQWVYLRKQVPQAHWWIVACALATFIHSQLARILFLFGPAQWVFDLVAALTLGALTAYAMFALIERRPEEKQKPEKLHRSLRPRPNRYTKKKDEAVPKPRPAQRPIEKIPVDQAPVGQAPVGPAPVEPKAAPRIEEKPQEARPATAGKAAEKLVLVKKKTRLQETGEAFSAHADFVFVLPARPRRARLRLTYSGMSEATQVHFRQHIQLNDQMVFELQPRGRKLGDAEEYVLRIEAELFSHRNRIVVLSLSDGRPQSKNPFVLHAAQLEFDW